MKRVIAWLKQSNRAKHLGYGFAIGLGADSVWCAAYVGAGVGAAMEYKDKAWGGKWDNIDLALTFAGAMAGYGVRASITNIL